jgi:hypothetical protein
MQLRKCGLPSTGLDEVVASCDSVLLLPTQCEEKIHTDIPLYCSFKKNLMDHLPIKVQFVCLKTFAVDVILYKGFWVITERHFWYETNVSGLMFVPSSG